MKKPFYITTAIDYPNALPHIGTAFEKVGADVQQRFRRFDDRMTYLLMGNDENTQKVARAAKKLNEPTQQYADRMAEAFKASWQKLDIDYGHFCQTSAANHHEVCRAFLQKVYENGYIYPKYYEGLYCGECEEFKQSVVNGECPNHPGVQLQNRREKNYWFAQKLFKEKILKLYAEDKIKIYPEHRQREMLNFIEGDLEDISITRQNQGWGIPVPFDESQVIYVWFDALLNYLTWSDSHWPADVHVIGKDIVRFHGYLFPAMLLAHNENVMGEQTGYQYPLPSTIFSHGFVCRKTDNGLTKFSKSSGDSLGPDGLVDTFGSDAYRYLFMKSANFESDAEYSFGMYAETYNADLVNKYGNLFSRVTKLALTKLDGVIPACEVGQKDLPLNFALIDWWQSAMGAFKYRDALVVIMEGIDKINKLLDDRKPWADDATDVGGTLAIAAKTLKTAAFLFSPVMPKSSRMVWDALKYEGDPGLDKAVTETLTGYVLTRLPLTIDANLVKEGKMPILFPRYKG